jgi:hypothetical protein
MRIDYSAVSHSYVSSRLSLGSYASFRVMQVMRARKMQVDPTSVPEWILNNKIRAYDFIDLLNIPRPRLTHSGVRLSEILPRDNVVIKPYNGTASKGVYLAFHRNHIFKVKAKEKLESWSAMLDSMRSDLSSGIVKQDRWIVEELILEDERKLIPARDLKFYCFYGKVALVFEVIRYPTNAYCYWTPDKVRTTTGAYAEKSFEGAGFSDAMLEIASSISLHIPSPFMRIDFHKKGQELVFCEFTPRPGPTWLYDQKTDQMLGDAFLAAEGRLLNDLLAGKTFDLFKRIARKDTDKHRPSARHAIRMPAVAGNMP